MPDDPALSGDPQPDLSLSAPIPDEPTVKRAMGGSLDADAPGFQPPPAPDPVLPAITRAECTKLGLKIFGFGMGLPILAAALFPLIQGSVDFVLFGKAFPTPSDIRLIGLGAYCAVPPMAFLGALLGFDTFQLISGARKLRRLPGVLWIVLGVVTLPYFVTFILIVPLYLHGRMREKLIKPDNEFELWSSWLHFLYLLGLPVVLFVGTSALRQALEIGSREHEMIGPLILCAWSVVWLGDNLMLLMFTSWRSARLLAPAPSRSLQFSLGAMMLTLLLGGGWVSGLILIFGP